MTPTPGMVHDVTIPASVFGLLLALLLILLYRMASNTSTNDAKRFSFEDWFIDPHTQTASLGQAAFFLTVIVLTWGFVFLVVSDRLTEWYLTAYGAIGTTAYLGSKVMSLKGAVQLAAPKAPVED